MLFASLYGSDNILLFLLLSPFYENLDKYIEATPYFGALIGRYGNRIAKGKFTLNGIQYSLATNDGPNHLHGGLIGFNKVLWNAEEIQTNDGAALKLTYLSKDGEEGYPGNVMVTVTYTLTNNNELKISYHAQTDKPTPLNLTNHSYFNLAGHNSGDILNHELTINADSFTPTDKTLIPTGQIKTVKGTPMDFTARQTIGARITQLKDGYDHNYVLNNGNGTLSFAARVCEPETGRVMQIYTTEPALQLYTANLLDGTVKGKDAAVYNKHDALCLETQHFPDSPNRPQFSSAILQPGEEYTQLTVNEFSVQ